MVHKGMSENNIDVKNDMAFVCVQRIYVMFVLMAVNVCYAYCVCLHMCGCPVDECLRMASPVIK